MLSEAPLFEIEGWRPPPDGRAFYVDAADGVRLRGAFWPGRGRGVVLIFQGRAEFIEKYYGVVTRLLGLGYDVAAIDWRGQGLSQRLNSDRRLGHIDDFSAYQRDLDALLRALAEVGAPTPAEAARLIFAHSMGGAIAARAMMRSDTDRATTFKVAILSAPMLRLAGGGAWRAAASGLSRMNRLLGRGTAYVRGEGPVPLAEKGFDGNPLTTDARHFGYYAGLIKAHPDLALGGPSWGWLAAATREMRALRPGKTPVLGVLGLDDQVIDNAAARAFVDATPKGRVLEITGARHEPYIEAPAHQERLWRGVAEYLDVAGA